MRKPEKADAPGNRKCRDIAWPQNHRCYNQGLIECTLDATRRGKVPLCDLLAVRIRQTDRQLKNEQCWHICAL